MWVAGSTGHLRAWHTHLIICYECHFPKFLELLQVNLLFAAALVDTLQVLQVGIVVLNLLVDHTLIIAFLLIASHPLSRLLDYLIIHHNPCSHWLILIE